MLGGVMVLERYLVALWKGSCCQNEGVDGRQQVGNFIVLVGQFEIDGCHPSRAMCGANINELSEVN